MSTNTVNLHRVLTTKPEKIYRAFLDRDAIAKWLPPNGYTCSVHHMEAKVRRNLQDVFYKLYHSKEHVIWWRIP
jgi:uncharacterized protein YndB with AHSA1/START domain